MPPRTTTTARQQRVGVELRKMREAAGFTSREAAARLGIDHTKISHMEAARFGVSVERLRMLASGYGCDDESYVNALAEMASERGKGWWERYRGILPAGFLDLTELECRATALSTYQVAHVPGLAQTEDYARAVFGLTFPRLTKDGVEARISHRIRRAEMLEQQDAPTSTALIHEAALRMRFGGRELARAQLEHLLKLSEHPKFTMRVIPFEADGFAGSGQAVLYASGPVAQLDTVQLDSAHGAIFLDAQAQLKAYRDLLAAMERRSLSVRRSRDLTRKIAREL
ncbi:MAG: helix-turn-helix domain-containing protein [Streptomyces sp.]|uniref:helix-turn-helix domain-containing protein n=1 Tax=Streptomyces sp. TaxID=1931 RepID=UPI003D6AC1EE